MTLELDPFKIYIDRLREGQTYAINEIVPPDFLDINEKELSFIQPITINGEAYLADQDLVIKLGATAVAVIPCTILKTGGRKK